MSVQHTNFNTSQDKGKTGQEVNNQELIKKKSPDNSLASIFLAVAFYLAIVYLALFLLLGLSNPWGMIVILFLRYSLISFIIATILIGKGLKKENIFASCSGLAPVFVSGSLQQFGWYKILRLRFTGRLGAGHRYGFPWWYLEHCRNHKAVFWQQRRLLYLSRM